MVNELRGVGVDGQELVSLDGATLVNGVTSDVDDTAEGGRADGNCDGSTSISGLGTTDKTLSTYLAVSDLLFLEVVRRIQRDTHHP